MRALAPTGARSPGPERVRCAAHRSQLHARYHVRKGRPRPAGAHPGGRGASAGDLDAAWGNSDLAVESIKRGARDFIQKPWENERLISLIRVHAELHRALRRARQLEMENRLLRADGMPEFLAGAPAMQPVLELIAQVGPSDANVLITGEHGTGKEIVAKLLHAASPRSRMPLVAVNAGGLPEGTFESEIFGHVKGAFTDARTDRIGRFELANNGTLFLDEIANVPIRQQAKLLRVLETGELERVGVA